MERILICAVAILLGGFPVICSIFDFNWFFNTAKARFFVNIFGRNGARIFYTILGGLIILLGIVTTVLAFAN